MVLREAHHKHVAAPQAQALAQGHWQRAHSPVTALQVSVLAHRQAAAPAQLPVRAAAAPHTVAALLQLQMQMQVQLLSLRLVQVQVQARGDLLERLHY